MNYLQKKKQAIIMMLAAQIIKTAQGYPVAINDCESGTAVDYTVWGNTVTGKNLLDIPSEYTWTGHAQKSTHIPAGQYVLSWTSTIWGGASSPVIRFAKNNKLYWMQKNSSFRSVTLTQPETTIQVYANDFDVVASKNVTSTINQLMLELGTTATEYEPYTEKYVGDKTLVSDNTYKYKIPIVNLGKNLIPYPYSQTTKTENGITFTDNGDGSVTVSGTATEYVAFNFVQALPCRPNQAYTIVKNGVDVNNVSFVFCDVNENGKITRETVSTTREKTFTVTTLASTAYIKLLMKRQNNAKCTGTVKPTLELGETATEYEPYRVPVTANIYLDEPLKKGESINFGADNLPGLQLFEGSNVITADTAVKPSDIEIRYTVKQ